MTYTSKFDRLRSKLNAGKCRNCKGSTLYKVWLGLAHLGYTKCRYCQGTGCSCNVEDLAKSLIHVSDHDI